MKRILVIVAVVVLGGVGVWAFSGGSGGEKEEEVVEEQEASYKKISAEEAKGMMGEGKDYVLLDVRTEEEFAEERIEGAVLIPDYEVGERAGKELPDKDAVILVYCRSGGRSARVARELGEMGYENVYDMGGIREWPFGTVRGELAK